jgi:hypothetical protein
LVSCCRGGEVSIGRDQEFTVKDQFGDVRDRLIPGCCVPSDQEVCVRWCKANLSEYNAGGLVYSPITRSQRCTIVVAGQDTAQYPPAHSGGERHRSCRISRWYLHWGSRVHIGCAEEERAEPKRHSEQRSNAVVSGRSKERGPSICRMVLNVGFEDRCVVLQGVPAGTLLEVELQPVDSAGTAIGDRDRLVPSEATERRHGSTITMNDIKERGGEIRFGEGRGQRGEAASQLVHGVLPAASSPGGRALAQQHPTQHQ